MNIKPKVLINVIPFNPDGDQIFIGEKSEDDKLGVISGKLKFGEQFEDCAIRLISENLSITIKDYDRIKFLCSYNIVDKFQGIHNVAITYTFTVTPEDSKKFFKVNNFIFKSWNFVTFEELLKYNEILSLGIKVFLKRFSIESIDDIKNLISN